MATIPPEPNQSLMVEQYKYEGTELEFFSRARNWKNYFASQIRPFLGNYVVEVGAGIGATSSALNDGKAGVWHLVEPDPDMAGSLLKGVEHMKLPSNCRVFNGTLKNFSPPEQIDSILYIDVLEHIENDDEEVQRACSLLKPGGHLIIISPAFQMLYSAFDKSIGHFRRYSRTMLENLRPNGMHTVKSRYLDSIGFFASLANKLLLKQGEASEKQVLFWDRYMIPVSRFSDKLIFYSFGKSILMIWKKAER